MTAESRRIAHLDMDAFYASVDLLRYPELRGYPVVIGGRSSHKPETQADGTRRFARLRDYVGRGVVTTSTYEARALGIFSAMGIMKAAHLAPDSVLLPADFDAYRHYSRLFKQAVAGIAPLIEDRGIDEIYIDLSEHPDDTLTLASAIKQAVNEATHLSCSICVAPNKLLAKIGSELDKPNGLTILTSADLSDKIWPLSVRKVNGIGPKAAERLAELHIYSIGDLAQTDINHLRQHFGHSYAQWLHALAQGIDDRPVVTFSEPKSLSRETTFERDLHARHDRDTLSPIFTELCHRLASDLARKGYVSRTIGVKLRYTDFRTVTRDLTLPTPTADAATIRRAAGECLRRIPLDQRLRLLGVKAGALAKAGPPDQVCQAYQGELFPEAMTLAPRVDKG